MKKLIGHIILCAMLASMLSGCAAYPVVQVAGGAMTGYDAVHLADEYMPRDKVKGGELTAKTDIMLQRRLRERLRMYNLRTVSAHVIDSQAYLVGQVLNRSDADQAVAVAKSVAGITAINCKFYPMGSIKTNNDDTRLLKALVDRLGSSKHLKNADLRVQVIQKNAILLGSCADWHQKTAASAIAAEMGDFTEVIDYLVVRKTPESPRNTVKTN